MRKATRDSSAAPVANLNLSLGNAVAGASQGRHTINSARSSSCAKDRYQRNPRNPPRSARAINPQYLYPSKGPAHVSRSSISGPMPLDPRPRKSLKLSKSKKRTTATHQQQQQSSKCGPFDAQTDNQEKSSIARKSEAKPMSRPPLQTRLSINKVGQVPSVKFLTSETPSVATAGSVYGKPKASTPRAGSSSRATFRGPSKSKNQYPVGMKAPSPRNRYPAGVGSNLKRLSKKGIKTLSQMNKENQARKGMEKRATSFIQEPLQSLVQKQPDSIHSEEQYTESDENLSLSGASMPPPLPPASAASQLLQHFQQQNIILDPNAGTPAVFKTFGKKLKQEIKAEHIIRYEAQEEDKYLATDQDEEDMPPKLATKDGQQEERKLLEIEELQRQIEVRWKELKIPKLDRIHFKRLFFFQEFSLRALRRQLELLETYKQMTQKIMVKVLEREKVLKFLKQLGARAGPRESQMHTFETEMVPLFQKLRHLNINIIEAICIEWRSILWLPQPFLYKDQNYLEKILEDYKELLACANQFVPKMLIYVEDMMFFRPKPDSDILQKLQQLIGVHTVPKQEVKFFNDICNHLKSISEYPRIKAAQTMLQDQQNCQRQLADEKQKMKESGEFTPFLRWKPPKAQTRSKTKKYFVREESFDDNHPDAPGQWDVSPIASRMDPGLITLGNLPNIEGSGGFSLSDGAGSRAGDMMYVGDGSGGVDFTLDHPSSSLCLNSEEVGLADPERSGKYGLVFRSRAQPFQRVKRAKATETPRNRDESLIILNEKLLRLQALRPRDHSDHQFAISVLAVPCVLLLTKLVFSSAQGDTPHQDLKLALHLNETQYGILAGPAFSIFFAVSNIFMVISANLLQGYCSDKFNRKWLLLISCAMFSLMTLLTAYAHKFWHILLLRLGLGIFQSTVDLAGPSLIADYFYPKERSVSMSIYGFGLYIGVCLSTFALALINDIGWRDSFLYIGLAGIINSLLLLFVREPERGRYDEQEENKTSNNFFVFFKQSLFESFKNPIMRWIIIACAFRISAGFCIGFYYVTYVTKQYKDHKTLFSYFQAGVVLICGTISTYLGGYLARSLQKRNCKGARGYVPGFGVLIAIPFEICSWVIFRNIYLILSFNAVAYLFAENWTGPIFSLIVDTMPKDLRASAIAINLFVYTVVSDVWVVVLGAVLDAVNSDQYPIRIGYWLAIFVCSLYLLSFPCYVKLGYNQAKYIKTKETYSDLPDDE